MKRDLQGKRLVITGASSGIGKCLAEEAARQGARLVLAARSADKLKQLAQAIQARGGEAIALPADVTSDSERRRLIDSAAARLGGIDVLINNAGIASHGHFATSSEEILRQIMEVNFFAPAELIRTALPVLQQGNEPAIVNVASMCGRRGMPAWPEYSASKFALCGLTEALRGEMARFDIDVVLILPGLTRSDFPSNLLRREGRVKIDFDKGMPPEYVAGQILDALKRGKAEVVLGREAKWILLVNRFLPRLVNRLLSRKVAQAYAQENAPAQP